MKRTDSRRGFTLIEVLVASLLLAMLVTALTMVFNQSAIAWRTGKAGLAQLSKIRRQVTVAQYQADHLLPRIDKNSKGSYGMSLSAWDEDGKLRKRSVGKVGMNASYTMPSFSMLGQPESKVQPWAMMTGLGSIKPALQNTYIVGVHSWGPDGVKDTDDDISTWPGEVTK